MVDLPTTEHVKLDLVGPVLSIVLDRPESRNAMGAQMTRELAATFAAVRDDRGVRVVVLSGAGGSFCAGADLKGMLSGEGEPAETDGDPWIETSSVAGRLFAAIDGAPQLVIGAVEGAAMGGGLGLVCCCDVVVATADAKLGMPEVTMGIPPAQIAPYVVARLGRSQARRLALTGTRIDGAQAVRVGLVHEVVADAPALDARVEEIVARALRCAPGAVAATKEIILGDVDDIAELARVFTDALRGPEGGEGVASFVEKRRPDWAPGAG